MQFIVNLFGTVHASKDIGKQTTTGLRILDEKLRVISNHVDFLLQEHFSQQSCRVKTCDVYTSDDVGCEDREGGGNTPSAADSDGEEEDGGREEEVDADIPEGNTQGNGAGEGQAGAGSGEASTTEGRANASNSDGQGRGESA
jgi:hypothetical protein